MRRLLLWAGLLLLFCANAFAQPPGTSCGQKQATEELFRKNPLLRSVHEQIEARLYQYNRTKNLRGTDQQTPSAIVTLPVVVHIIHNNGPENISNAQVQTAIQHLNEAFANTGYYDPSDGVNTQIQFCLAQRDPDGNATNGINRVVSPLTNMNGISSDMAVKNLSRWNPNCYINIWVVKNIGGGIAGYAYFPSAHGTGVDGIVLMATYFGSSHYNDVVITHEMGHYLGLYHTFEGGCKNDDCAADGDRICDTPPDQSTVGLPCNYTANSCSTDAPSGFSTDQNDLLEDYMDYGNWDCMKVFTQGQSDRMNWVVQNVRQSLLNCKSCLTPCPAIVTANFNSSANNVGIGSTVNFTNSSSNATGYRWYVNNVLQATTSNYSQTFNTAGTYVIRLVALPGSALCDSSFKTDTIRVTCPVTAAFTPISTSSNVSVTVNFTNASTGASNYSWHVDGNLQGTGNNFSYAFTTPGNYIVKLVAGNGVCSDSAFGSVVVRDTCVRQTFHKMYGGTGDDVAYDVRSTTDGGYIMAGKTNSFSINYDGYVVKLDDKGNVQWSRTYGGPAEDVINKILQTSDGGYIFTGTARSFGNTAGDAWVVKTDGIGMVQWAKRFGENTANGEQGLGVCITSDGGYAIIGSQNAAPGVSNVMVLKLDASGNLQWSKIFDSGNTDGGSYIVQDNNVLMATAFTRQNSSYHDALVMKIDIANGNLLWLNKYDVDGRNNFSGEIYKVGNGYKFHIPSIQDFSNLLTSRHIILTLDNNGNTTAIQQLVPPDFGSGPIVIAPDGGIVAAYNEQNVVSEFNLIKLNGGGALQWAKKYVRPGPQFNSVLRSAQDGGYITIGASNPASNNDIYFAKVDIQGNSAGCDTASIPVTVQSPPHSSGGFTWNVMRDGNFTNVNISVPGAVVATQHTELCAGTTCVEPPPPPVDDTCTNTYYQKKYDFRNTDEFYSLTETSDHRVLVAGSSSVTNTSDATDGDAFIMKLNSNGDPAWSSYAGGSKYDHFHRARENQDKTIIAVGTTVSYSPDNASRNIYVAKFSASGQLLWARHLRHPSYVAAQAFDVGETSDGGYLVCAKTRHASANTKDDIMMIRLDAGGAVLWTRLFGMDQDIVGAASLIIHRNSTSDTAYIAGEHTGFDLNKNGLLLKMNAQTGDLYWTKRYDYSGGPNSTNNYFKLVTFHGNELRINMEAYVTFPGGENWMLNLDRNGNILKTRKLVSPPVQGHLQMPQAYPTPDDGFVIARHHLQSPFATQVIKIDSAGGLAWAKQYNVNPVIQEQFVYTTFVNSRNDIFITGTEAINQPGNMFVGFITKLNSEGDIPNSSCTSRPVTATTGSGNLIITDHTWQRIENLTMINTLVSSAAGAANVTVTERCAGTITCDSLRITGNDTACNLEDVFVFNTSSTCQLAGTWEIDTSFAEIVSKTGAEIRIRFKKTGTVRLYSKLMMSCSTLIDSMDIYIFDGHDVLDLGPDREICKVSIIPLNAGSGFNWYKWQDGSTDSTFTVYQPGTYFVEAGDVCGNIMRDTVVISLAPDIPFDLGSDITKCNTDTVTLTAPGGFAKYTWAANYNISNRYSQVVQVWPTKDTVYSVLAETTDGCIVYDTVNVKVKTSLPLKLANDTSFCRSDSLIITADPGFSSYNWNTGETTQQIVAKNKGLYILQAVAPNNCVSKDTLEILDVHALPLVDLGKDTLLCMNSDHTFDAGNFATYLWHDGSAGRRFTASHVGEYWVKVTDVNGCVNSDTAEILRIADLPAQFLDTAAEVCPGERITLTPKGSFSKYRWSTGSTTRSIDVGAAAQYWLEVTNADGCTNREFINVKQKFCRTSIDFPNAFTPNNDRKHDTYKPIIKGILTKYKLTIYNRWGQRVFETSQPTIAWDGTLAGMPQDTGTFVWYCEYQFQGEPVKAAKGMLILAR